MPFNCPLVSETSNWGKQCQHDENSSRRFPRSEQPSLWPGIWCWMTARQTRRRNSSGRSVEGTLSSQGQGAIEIHARCAQAGAHRTAVRRHEGFRRAEAGPYRSDERPQDHGGRRPCRLGHGAVSVSGQAGRLRQHSPLAAASVQIEQQLRIVRSDPGHLSGARLRPLRHHLRSRQDRLDRVRSAGVEGAGRRSLETVSAACRPGPACFGGDLFAHPCGSLGRRARHRR